MDSKELPTRAELMGGEFKNGIYENCLTCRFPGTTKDCHGCAVKMFRNWQPKEKCLHGRLMAYHDNSILCLECDEIIWQDLHGAEYPNELKARFESREK